MIHSLNTYFQDDPEEDSPSDSGDSGRTDYDSTDPGETRTEDSPIIRK